MQRVLYVATLDDKHAYEYILVRKEHEVVEGWRPKKSESAIHTVLFAYKFPKGWLTKKAKAERAALPGVTCIFEPNVSMFTIEKWTPNYSEPRGCYSLRRQVKGDDCVVSVRGWAEEFFGGLQTLRRTACASSWRRLSCTVRDSGEPCRSWPARAASRS